MLIANKAFSYGGRRLKLGDTFEAKNSTDEKLLLAVKSARAQTVLDGADAEESIQADGSPQSEPAKKGRKGTYLRRDMVAEPPASEVAVRTITGDAEPPEHLAQSSRES